MENKFPMIIGGEKISSEQLIGVINPSNEQLVGYVFNADIALMEKSLICLLYTSPSPRDCQ